MESPSEGCDLPGLFIRLLGQLSAMSETAAQIKKLFQADLS